MKFTNNVYLMYEKSITEDIFNHIIQDLKNQGFSFVEHCSFKYSYSSFVLSRYLVIDTTGKCYEYGEKVFTIDNNSQTVKKQIFLKDILVAKTEGYEIF